MAFQCVIVTPEQQAFDERITQAIVPAHDGQIGILTDRAPLLVKLGIGALQLDLATGQRRTLFIEGGIAQMKDNRLTIVTNEAMEPSQIDAESARAEFAEATAQRPTDQKSHDDRQWRMQRARVMQELARK
ncbi:MAG TPA: ATP synthase F1 subunit epsilon [Tepidisphaeraceae bacterium]|nr:ATP synthase F1 subunit epsilon [Tepidisphaeraceae bacterium]